MSALTDAATSANDLDAFLTMMESKLRGPFSSLDLAKAVSTVALSSNDEATQYLHNVAAVLPRAEKVTQLRILTGLLGLEPAETTDGAAKKIVEAAQEAPVYEEWVRVIGGLVQGIIFQTNINDDDENITDDSQSSDLFTGKEAKQLLGKTCREILDRVRKLERETAVIDENTEYRLGQSDSNPLFAPYRYALLCPDLLQAVLPEVKRHDHFKVNEIADILSMDEKIEVEKAKEEQDHQQAGLLTIAEPKPAVIRQCEAPDFPGFRTTTKPTNSAATRPKSSMFMPAKPQAALAAAKRTQGTKPGALKPMQKPVLHQRKAGAAQTLLAKSRRARLMKVGAATTQATTPTTVLGRTASTAATANAMGNARSKMKMIDVAEVQGLETRKQEAAVAPPPAKRGRKAQLLSGNKRSKPELVAADYGNDKVSRLKKASDAADNNVHVLGKNSRAPPVTQAPTVASYPTQQAAAGALASAALNAYQAQLAVQPQAATATMAATVAGTLTASGTKQQDWRQLLKEKSNRLSEDDRLRVQQFFVSHFNPTPEQSKFKLKLHEERTTDTKTGEPVKETYYLELDYNSLTSKQSKKVKRYKDDGL